LINKGAYDSIRVSKDEHKNQQIQRL